jgi:hypothetical protein
MAQPAALVQGKYLHMLLKTTWKKSESSPTVSYSPVTSYVVSEGETYRPVNTEVKGATTDMPSPLLAPTLVKGARTEKPLSFLLSSPCKENSRIEQNVACIA